MNKSKTALFAITMCCSAGIAQAAVDISSTPLQTGTAVDPNILFLIDDSGSMRWGFMPDDLVTRISNGQRLPDCSGRGDYAGSANTCFLSTTGRTYLVSGYLNKIYYDPDETYTPPVKEDGTLYANASYTAAKVDGYSSSSGSVNLATQYRAIMDDYYYYGRTSGSGINRVGFTVSPSGNAGSAFYYSFKSGCASQYSDSCYGIKYVAASEQVNFANWFSYYRTRMMAAKAGIGRAFQPQPTTMRVGYAGINKASGDGTIKNAAGISSQTKKFEGSSRTAFFNWLYGKEADGATPLIGALTAAGEYFSSAGPWRSSDTDITELTCRQSFTMLMTDGYYSDSGSGTGNADGTNGSIITSPDGKRYQYKAVAPFQDSHSNTLADVAMKYWRSDLRPALENRVPATEEYPAFWQHMVTFGIGFGVTADVAADTAFAAIRTKTTISWPNPANSNSAKIDDLLHASVNSRGGFFSAANPTEFAKGLTGTLNSITARVGAASNLAAVSASTQAGAKVFQGRYVSGKWDGDLWAYDLEAGTSIAWKASEKLPRHSDRNIKFVKSGVLTDFKPDNLTTAQLGVASTAVKTALVNYLRGERSNEVLSNGVYKFRDRVSPLGDIANSSPVYVAAPERMGYQRYTNWPEAVSYEAFLAAHKNRKHMVYVGANDGMFHAFDATTGVETFAYIPQAVLPELRQLSDIHYAHKYYVDGNATVRDIYLDNKWRTVLLSTTGRGQFSSMFALDITDPGNIQVLFDITVGAIGQNVGTPVVARANDGLWTALLGSGYNNSANRTGLLYFKLSQLNGQFGSYTGAAVTMIAATNDSNNGLSKIESWDYDFDGNLDFVYGGDVQGNIWKFDLRGATGWKIANRGQPLFKAAIAGKVQPVTGGLTLSAEPGSGKLWLHFGTGKYLTLADLDSASFSTQSMYGITDDFSDAGVSFSRNDLQTRLLSSPAQEPNRRGLSASTALAVNKRGWYIDLSDGERVVLPALLADQQLEVTTIIPDNDPCLAGGTSWKLAIDPYKGGRLRTNYFDTNTDGKFDEQDNLSSGEVTSGVKTDGIISGRDVVRKKDGKYVGVDGKGDGSLPPPGQVNVGIRSNRLTWRELQ